MPHQNNILQPDNKDYEQNIDIKDNSADFELADHYSLKSTFQRRKDLTILNEGSNQYIFKSEENYFLFNDAEKGFFAVRLLFILIFLE